VRPASIRELERSAAHGLLALDRRGFLVRAGLAGAAACLPAGCGDPPPGAGPPAGVSLQFLSPRGYAVLNAAAERIAGPTGAALVRDRRVDPAATAERFLAGAPALVTPLGHALLVLEFATWPFVSKLRPFTALGPGARDAVLAELMRSRLQLGRAVFGGVRSVAVLGLYAGLAEARLPGVELGRIPEAATIADAMRLPAPASE
jgi:hypothetical protein